MLKTEALPALIQPGEVVELAREDPHVRILDVRTPAEFESAHIPGSYNVPLDQLTEHRAELRGVGRPFILVCRSGLRARQAEMLLREADLERLHVLEGGLAAVDLPGRVRRSRPAVRRPDRLLRNGAAADAPALQPRRDLRRRGDGATAGE